MTQDSFFSQLDKSISEARIGPYRQSNQQSETAIYAAYAWNIAVCESLYPILNAFEVALRNSTHTAASQRFGSEHWFIGRLGKPEEYKVSSLRMQADPNGSNLPSSGYFLSGLTLGFWVSLFQGRYEQILWPWLLAPIFPYASSRQRAREPLYQRLDRIRRLRNRVFHHEPIWHLPDLQQRHQEILETIGWISPAMLAMTRLLDRFSTVYTGGAQPYATELENIAQDWAR